VGHGIADRQTVATLGATRRQNLAAVFAGHAFAETVFVHTLAITGIVSSLHDWTPNKDRSRRIYIHKPFIFKGMGAKARQHFQGGGGVGRRVFGVIWLTKPVLLVLSSILAALFAASGLRSRILRHNFQIIKLRAPKFYRIRLGFHLAYDFLSLILPGSLPVVRLHPRSAVPGGSLDALRSGPSLLLTAHFGNWEAQAAAWGRLGVRLLGAARPLRSRIAHNVLARLRARHGIHVVTTAVPRTALRHIHPPQNSSPFTPNVPGCFGILWDQHAPQSTRPGSFFGEPVSLNPLPFFLLERNPCPVYFGVLLPGGTMRLVPLLARFDQGWENRLARRYHRVLETLVRRYPTHWHGALHARFKMTRVYVGHRGKSY
jgi:hypothetical protein